MDLCVLKEVFVATLESEKELEDFLHLSLDEHLEINSGDVYRQVNIPGYGVVDLLSVNIGGDWDERCRPLIAVTIIELKKGDIDFNALGQICRYKVAIERFFEKSKHYYNVEVRGILVGSGYTSGDICYAVDSIDWLSCSHFSMDLASGITFEDSSGWYSTDENFKKLIEISQDILPEYINAYKCFWRNCKPRPTKTVET